MRALTPIRPSLTWTGTVTADTLASNGEPGWYDPHGQPHTAVAHTWRHRFSGRCGTAVVPGYNTAVLPLTLPGVRPPVIDVLRAARTRGRHWLSVDVDDHDEHVIGPDRVITHIGRDELVPAHALWIPAAVTCPAVADIPYPAWIAGGYRSSDGHILPRFARIAVERIIADLQVRHAKTDRRSDPMPGEYPLLRWHGHTLLVEEERDNDESGVVELDRIPPDSEGRYPLGAYLWPWRQTTPA